MPPLLFRRIIFIQKYLYEQSVIIIDKDVPCVVYMLYSP